MDHTKEIESYIKVLLKSERFHILTIAGPPGWGKSFRTRETLLNLNIDYEFLGSYSTALALYNHICEFPDKVTVVDDASGIYGNPQSMAIINAASWPGSSHGGKRLVKWASTSELVAQPSIEFTGKLIVLTNFLPDTPQIDAFRNRSLHCDVSVSPEEVGELLSKAVKKNFATSKTAPAVADYLGSLALEFSNRNEHCPISLRTLEMGVELAEIDSDNWENMLKRALNKIPRKSKTLKTESKQQPMVSLLQSSGMKVEEQFKEFQRLTGKSRRAFFYARKKQGLQSPA